MKKIFLNGIISTLLFLWATAVNAQQEGRLPVMSEQAIITQSQSGRPLPPSEVRTSVQRTSVAKNSSLLAAADALVNNNSGATGTSFFTQSETSILAFGNNVVIGFNDAGSRASGSHFTGWSYSSDGGATFTDGGALPASALGDAGDPVLARNNTTGRIYFSTLGFNSPGTIQMWRSDDNAVSWLAPVNATPGGTTEDKQWHTVDNFAGGGNGNVYILSRRFAAAQGIYFFRSTDHGATFGPAGGTLIASNAAGNVQGAFIVVSPDHSISAFYFDDAANDIRVRRSTDFGATWSAPVIVVSGLPAFVNGGLGLTGIRNGLVAESGFRSNSFPHAAANPVSGHLYVTYNNDVAGADKADVFYVISTDNGATWSAPVRINDDATTTDQWFPTLAVSPNGLNIGFFYYSRQEDEANNNLFKYYGRTGTISGSTVTLAPSFAVSDVASLPEFGRDAAVNSVYMGDYNQVVTTATDFHVVWSDNRDDLTAGPPRKDPNVYYKKVALVQCVPGELTCSIASIPSDNTYTGGVPTNIYLGYGSQSTTLQVTVSGTGAPYTYAWTGNGTLSNYNTANPVFAPTAEGIYTFTVTVTNNLGCTTTCNITIHVYDIRVPGRKGKKVYLCHAPPDNPSNAHTLSVSVNAVPGHLANHPDDRLGSCDLVIATSRIPNLVIDESIVLNRVKAYPNPNRGSFDLELSNYKTGKAEIRIMNKNGVVIERRTVQINGKGQVIHFNLKNRSAGMYFVQVVTSDGTQSSKIVINR